MRILVVSNLYPPLHQGGYELGCKDVVEQLKARGHTVKVLTSTYRCEQPVVEDDVYRWLQLSFDRIPSADFTIAKERINQSAFRRLCDAFHPDVVFLWNLTHISISLAELARVRGIPTTYYISDNWLATWEMDHWYQLHRNRGARNDAFVVPPPLSLNLDRTIFASEYLRDRVKRVGKDVATSRVIHWGVDTRVFQSRPRLSSPPMRLLVAGQILPHKGIHTALDALAELARISRRPYQLTVVGDCDSSPRYVAQLRHQASALGVADRVSFTGRISRDRLPDVYLNHDVLIFPSIWDEPFAITPLEAMATQMAVVGTPTGGSPEVFEHESNAMVFATEDASDCAAQIERLCTDQMLFASVCHAARRTIEGRFTMQGMVDRIERILSDSVGPAVVSESSAEQLPPPEIRLDQVPGSKNRPRRLVRRLADAVLSNGMIRSLVEPKSKAPVEARNVQTALILLLGDLTEAVFAIPSLRSMRRLWPNAHLTLVVQPQIKPLLDVCPYVDEIRTFAWKDVPDWQQANIGNLVHWVMNTWREARPLNAKSPDVAISMKWDADTGYIVSGLYMAMARARQRIAFRHPAANRTPRQKALDLLSGGGPSRGLPLHEIHRQADMLRFVGANPETNRLEIWTTPRDDQYVNELLLAQPIQKCELLVAFAPSGALPGREWPAAKFIELGYWLMQQYGASIVIVDQHESQTAHTIEAALGKRSVNLSGKTSLRQLAALLQNCGLVVSADSETLYLATAAGIPLVGLFGSGEYQRFRPLSRAQSALHLGLRCSPCFTDCMFDRPHCIEGIGVDQVKASVMAMLQTSSRIPSKV